MSAVLEPSPPEDPSGNWSSNTKLLASLVFLVLIGLSLWKFRHLLQPIVVSVVVAYLLHPLVTRLTRLPFLSRAVASVLVFATFFVVSIFAILWLGSAAFIQLELLLQGMPIMVSGAQAYIRQAVGDSLPLQRLLALPEMQGFTPLWNLGGVEGATQTWDVEAIVKQALAAVNPVLRQSGSVATSLARGTFNALTTTIIIFILSLYMIIDIPRVEGYIGEMAPIRSVQNEMKVLWRRFSQIWGAYLRGQINISILMFFTVSVMLSLLGVKNAFGLGLLAGAMEFLPLIGPFISFTVAVLAAFFQDSTVLNLSTQNYTLLVALALLALNLLESNVLVPRVLGSELRLHPLVVLISVLMGTSLAGILGAILAAPVAATLKLMGTYTWHRILDQPPHFLHEEVNAAEMAKPNRWQILKSWALKHAHRAAATKENGKSEQDSTETESKTSQTE